MRSNSLNYDKLAPEYDLRYQKDQRQGTLNALRRILSEKTPYRVLEIGCGTCHWLMGLRVSKRHLLVGIDKAHNMLKQPQNKDQLQLCQGMAENLPLKSGTFDFIYCVNAIHHFSRPSVFIRQAQRLLRPGGSLAILGMNPQNPRNNWYIYDFFEGTRTRDLARFPDWKQVKLWLEEANFTNIVLDEVEFIHDPKTPAEVLEDPFLKKNACSQLALLSLKEYLAGLNKLHEHVKSNINSSFRYQNDILISMLIAEKK